MSWWTYYYYYYSAISYFQLLPSNSKQRKRKLDNQLLTLEYNHLSIYIYNNKVLFHYMNHITPLCSMIHIYHCWVYIFRQKQKTILHIATDLSLSVLSLPFASHIQLLPNNRWCCMEAASFGRTYVAVISTIKKQCITQNASNRRSSWFIITIFYLFIKLSTTVNINDLKDIFIIQMCYLIVDITEWCWRIHWAMSMSGSWSL